MFQLRLAGRVGLSLLLAAAAVVGSVQAFRLLLLPALVSLFHPGEALTSFLRRIGIFAFVLLAYWAYVRFHEKRKVDELRPTLRGIVVGGVTGAGLILLAALLLFALGAYEVTAYRGLQHGLLGVAGLIVVAAMLEEVVYRGIVFRILENAWGTTIALWLQALLFGLGHLENIEGHANTAALVTTVVSVTLLGALLTLVFAYARNLWVVAANHAAWNFSIILTGMPLSGLGDWVSLAPIASRYHGPDWLTGGVFGPEASLVTMVLACAVVAILWALARSRNRLVKAQTSQQGPSKGTQAIDWA
ncbi:lysostaphin resistance A-like protein [Lysobacter fragariae]